MRISTTLLISWLVCLLPYAHGEENKEYKVEMILFSHLDSQGTGAKRRPDGVRWPGIPEAEELSWDPALSDYVILSEFDKDLNSVVATLNQSPRHQVIMHLIWRQTMPTQSMARALHIHGGTDFSLQFPDKLDELNAQSVIVMSDQEQLPQPLEQVDGTITLFIGRYLHVITDLIYRQTAVLREENAENGEVRESNILVDYTIRNNRRMRSAELHYLDHPLLGILVQITLIEKNSQP